MYSISKGITSSRLCESYYFVSDSHPKTGCSSLFLPGVNDRKIPLYTKLLWSENEK